MNKPTLVLSVLSVACLAAPAHAQATVTVAQVADIRSTNPGVNRDNTTDGVLVNVVEGLVGYRRDGSIAPMLASSVQQSPDGLTYTFKLRSGVKFHDGSVMSSADVDWSWKRYMDPKTDWRCRSEFDGRGALKVVSTQAPDASTFVMTLEKPTAVFLDMLARPECGLTAVLHRSSVNADGSWNKPVGTGPFRLGEWRRGEYVTLTAFKDYVAIPGATKADGYVGLKTPKIDSVKFLVVPDPTTGVAGLKSGAIDATQIPASDVKVLRTDANLTLLTPTEATKHVLLFQTSDPLLKNVKLRQAIAAALDMNQIVMASSEGLGAVNNSAIEKTSAFYSSTHKEVFRHDPKRAAALLKEAGYKGEKITILANKRVHVPSFTVAILAQAAMQSAGINAHVEVLEWATQLDRYNSGKYQMSSFTYSPRIEPALSYEQFVGSKVQMARKIWDDAEAIQMVNQALLETEKAKRQALFDSLHKRMLDQVPMIMLYNGVDAWGVRKRVENFSVWEGKPQMWTASVKR